VGWFVHRSSAPPIPPLVPPDQSEPDVSAFIEKSRERVLKEPRSAQAWGALGQAFLANEMEDESRICFVEAERLDPSDPRWPYYQAGMLLSSGKPEAAVPYLRRAVERSAGAESDNPVPRLRLAETLLAVGRVDEAEDHFRQVLTWQPDDPRTHFGLALAAVVRQDWPNARSHLLHCLSSPVVRQKASAQLATVSQRLDDQADAEKYRQQADRLPADSDWSDPFATEYLRWAVKKNSRYQLADSLVRAGRLPEAVAELQLLLERYPDDYLPRLNAAKIFGRIGENRRAAMLLREAVRLAPDKVEAHYYLCLALSAEAEELTRSGDRDAAQKLYREAVDSARQALAIKPDFGYAYMSLGLFLKRLGQRADALAALQSAVRCNPEFADIHFHLGQMLVEEGRQSEAKKHFEQAVQMAPPNARWRQMALARLAAIRSAAIPKNMPEEPTKN